VLDLDRTKNDRNRQDVDKVIEAYDSIIKEVI
jgi:hypothetical protein